MKHKIKVDLDFDDYNLLDKATHSKFLSEKSKNELSKILPEILDNMIQEKIKLISNYPIGQFDYDWIEQKLIIDISNLSLNDIEKLTKLVYEYEN